MNRQQAQLYGLHMGAATYVPPQCDMYCLHAQIVGAARLIPTQLNGLADPYCRITAGKMCSSYYLPVTKTADVVTAGTMYHCP